MKKVLALVVGCLMAAATVSAQKNEDIFSSLDDYPYFLYRTVEYGVTPDFIVPSESGANMRYLIVYKFAEGQYDPNSAIYHYDLKQIRKDDDGVLDSGLVAIGAEGDQTSERYTVPSEVTYDGVTYPVWFIGNLNYSGFYSREYSSFTIPSSVVAIGAYSLPRADTLRLPKSIQLIDRYVFFKGSPRHSVLYYEGTLRDWLKINMYYPSANPMYNNFTTFYMNGEPVPENIEIPEGITNIKPYIFHKFRMKSVSFPTSLTKIQNDAFNLCESLTAVELPEALEILEAGAFRDCKSLTSVILPESVISIDGDAFTGCPRLATVICKAPITPEVKDNTFGNYNASLYVPDEYLHLYRGHAIWGNFREVIPFSQAPNHVKQLLHETTSKTAIANVEQSNIAIAAQNNSIVVKNAENTNISIFDVMGRTIVDQQPINHNDETIALPQRGMYIVRIGNNYSKKVFVK